MIDETCPFCKARHQAIMYQYHGRIAALHEGYIMRVIQLAEEHDANIKRQAEWRLEQLEIIEKQHTEHAGGDDA